ncbi:signal peptide peptidase-like 2B [Dysidea avara]|uniref:signal peptide peptidase-like 2B n=1 Tax=Dysidea avara TaxID=196820 RepID=UPI003330106E
MLINLFALLAMRLFVFLIGYCSLVVSHVRGDYAVLSYKGENTTRSYCVGFSDDWGLHIPSSPVQYVPLLVPDITNHDGCHNYTISYHHHVAILVNNDNCSVSDKVITAHQAEVDLLVIAGSVDADGLVNSPVTVVIISKHDAVNLVESSTVSVYQPTLNFPIGGIIVLFVIAMVTLICASALANTPFQFLRYGLLYRKGEPQGTNPLNNVDLPTWQLAVTIFLLVCLVVAFLILLYEFYSVMVYIAIAIYSLLCTRSVYAVLSPFVALIPLTSQWRLPANRLPVLKYRPDPRFFLTVLLSAGVVVGWFILRHSSYVWILHDFLGFAFICFAVKQFKTVMVYLWPLAVLMMCLFVYDIFFVFITPLIMKDSTSVMETVATGKGTGSNERIPFLFEVPRLTTTNKLDSVCGLSSPLLLGYGDIGIPAALVAFALHMDKTLHPDTPIRAYYITTVIGYAIGFTLCLTALMLMKTGQPALLYLVPCTLGPFLVATLIRKNFLVVWRGNKQTNNTPVESNGEEGKPDKCDDDETSKELEQSPLLIQDDEN